MGRLKERRAKQIYDVINKYDKELLNNFFIELEEFIKHLNDIYKDV